MPERSSFDTIKRPLKNLKQAAHEALEDHEKISSISSTWDVLTDSQETRYKRVKALFTICRKVLPDSLVDTLTGGRYAYDTSQIPIDFDQYVLEERVIGKGAESRVYKLLSVDAMRPSLVIKIDCSTRGESTAQILEKARVVSEEYKKIRDWYFEIPGFIPEEFHFIGYSPQGSLPALYTVQEFHGGAGDFRDIFETVSKEELLQILQNEPIFRKQFETFVDVTLFHAEHDNEMIDTNGKNNVVLIQKESGHQLVLLDTHGMLQPQNDTEYHDWVNADLEYLRRIKHGILQF